ncbi:MAG: N,N-dimethylformamidase beta subunit family domain-containing protein, partial [Pseudomonadota bacterium]
MTPLAAYTDRLSVSSGDTLLIHGRGPEGAALDARVVRVVSADPNPELGGVRTEPVPAEVELKSPLSELAVPLGSYGEVVVGSGRLPEVRSFTVSVRFRCTKLPDANFEAPLLTFTNDDDVILLALIVNGDGRLDVRSESGSGEFAIPFALGAWGTAVFRYDGDRGVGVLSCLNATSGGAQSQSIEMVPISLPDASVLRFGSYGGDQAVRSFNGCIERPELFARVLSDRDVADLGHGKRIADPVVSWDFSKDISSRILRDVGPLGLDGRLINQPTRGVRGADWSGREMAWRHAPDEYAAIHFHDDDIEDCEWPVIATWTVPPDLRSGQYAVILEAGGHTENVPFFVVPPLGQATARIAVLASTFTYTVYGNHARPEWSRDPAWQQAWRDQSAAWNAYPHNPGDHTDLGLSTYNVHSDGSGISIASWHRPMLNVRLGYLTYPYPQIRASGLRHYPADTHLTQWLESAGFDYDIITDWELHTEGIDVLSRYTSVL